MNQVYSFLMSFKKVSLTAVITLLFLQNVLAQSDTTQAGTQKELLEMTLEELLSIEIPTGTLVNIKQSSKPVAVTVITREDIKVSASRNMMDLLETYVPGFFWLDHTSEGMAAGMRGIVSDRNLKFLLLVNGVVVNNRAHKGMVSEISNWDLDDIEKIEVVRGPGSVTYGPGAIAGVISITTKRANGESVTGGSVNYKSAYESRGVNLYTSGKSATGVKSMFYGSIQSTDGINQPDVFTSKTFTDYGLPSQMKAPTAVNPYMRDARNIPQLKFIADFDFGKGYKFFTRYNQAGMYGHSFDRYKALSSFNTSNKPVYKGDVVPSMYNKHQQFLAVAEKKFTLNDQLDLNTSLIYDNENSASFRYQTSSALSNANMDSLKLRDITSITDLSSLRHALYQYSERQMTGKVVLTYKDKENKFQGAVGTEVTNNKWAAPWLKSASDIRLGDQKEILSDASVLAVANTGVTSVTGNQILASQGVYVGKGWTTNTVSFYGEGSYAFSKKISLLMSARTDKDTYSDWLLSPRVALLMDFDKHTLRLVGLQSTRMNTAAQMLVEHRHGRVSEAEKLQAAEVLYTYVHSPNLVTEANAYYNVTEVLGWSSSAAGVVKVGKAKTAGAEITVTYKTKNLSAGINHALVNLIDWKLAPGQTSSGISYADYNQRVIYTKDDNTKDTIYIKGTEKHLNNYAQNISKLFVTYNLLNQKLVLHLDTRVLWNFAGSNDGLSAYQTAVSNVSAQFADQVRAYVAEVRKNNIYKTDLRVNLSVEYKLTENIQLSAFANNLLYTNHARRYFYDSGYTDVNPSKIKYTQEPRFYGVKLACEF
ncbi:TonB-dependent receptor plug domain-containing protein [Xanthocytophaga flava]|uniref:TonB-dependent receptor plug domain-containing protein n=1 Tax=Xanthocytophaga flava TaxID=3048013 RepID=UPI0028D77C0A|nr:TonB-dependent receptor plug domain-containing protein [Xanthocytophaga flavus]MDJ1468856.1 TonB-dependent receptor plug domain-containing protein [Xanthocytophaga flavus]